MINESQKELGWSRQQIAETIAADIPDGSYVNLGIGMPESVVAHIPADKEVIFHTENGLLGMGPSPATGHEDADLINAGKRHVTAIQGACFFHHADSFVMIRGGHIDICVLGAMQVSQNGDLANWSMGEADAAPAVGGAMDLVGGARKIYVVTRHCTKSGAPKLVRCCKFPLTGQNVVDRVYTDLAVLEVRENRFEILMLAPSVDVEYVRRRTDADVVLAGESELRSVAT